MILLKPFYWSIFADCPCTFWTSTCSVRTTFEGKYPISSTLLSLVQAFCTCPRNMPMRIPGVGFGRYILLRVSLFVMSKLNFIAQVGESYLNDLVLL